MGNKSFSNEKKNSSLSNNYILNNIKINNQSSSFLFSEQKHKNYSQSPNNSSSNKHQKSQIKTKTIIYKKQLSGSPNRLTGKSQSQNEARESGGGGAGVDTFIYKKKNLNSENRYINKLQNFDLKSLYSQSKKYNKIINNNKKGKIVGIDINLGKPVNIINDHSPLDELLLEKNNSLLLKLNTISSKFMNKNKNKNKKKNKVKSGSKKKVKPPLRTKRFLEEDDDEFIQNYYMDSNSNSNSNSNRAYSSIKRYSKEHNALNKYLYNSLEEINSKINGDRDIIKKKKESKGNKEIIIEGDKLFIRIKYVTFFNNKKKNIMHNNNNFKYLIIDKKKSISFSINKKTKNKKTNEIKNKKGKNIKKKVSKLYVNCTKFLVKILIRLFKKKVFFIINNRKK
jgi:hypothetical protein